MKRALIAMSGGVDSAVSAYLMCRDGYDCVGVTMKLFDNEDISVSKENSCCSLDDINDARGVANSLGMPYYVMNFSDRFKECVIDKFVCSYEEGKTPNPCIECNRYLKFEKLFSRALELECDCVVTGHYARIEFDQSSGRYLLKKAVDSTKDQSYVLYNMTQNQLAHTVFPLGSLTKTEVREIASEQGFSNAKKHDSQDICFVQNGSYVDFIESYTGKKYPGGDFVDKQGNVLGSHKGIIRYTTGQRKGLGLALPQPMYVCELNIPENKVVLGLSEDLYTKTVIAKDINLISVPEIKGEMRVKAKVRYKQEEQNATAVQLDNDTIKLEFDEPLRAVTLGQSVVMYSGDTVVGGGVIERTC